MKYHRACPSQFRSFIAAGVRASNQNAANLIEMAMMMATEEQRRQTLAPWMAELEELQQSGKVSAFPDGDNVYYAYGPQR